jgi:hypothetical protein
VIYHLSKHSGRKDLLKLIPYITKNITWGFISNSLDVTELNCIQKVLEEEVVRYIDGDHVI